MTTPSCRVLTYWLHRYGWRWCQLQVMLVCSGWRSRPAAAAVYSPCYRAGDKGMDHGHARQVTRSVPTAERPQPLESSLQPQ